jgi:hypothetical protein
MISQRSVKKDLRRLIDIWERWLHVMARTREQSPDRLPKASKRAYRRLHRDLMETIKRAREACGQDESLLELLRKMEELSRPWVSLEAIGGADKHIRSDLFQRSRELQHHLTGEHPLRRRLIFVSAGLVLLVAIFLLVTHFTTIKEAWPEEWSLVRQITFGWQRIRFALRDVSVVEWLGGLVIVVLVLGALLLRSSRRY